MQRKNPGLHRKLPDVRFDTLTTSENAMAPEIEFTFLEPIGRRAILVVRETGLLTLQLWATIWRLPRVLPMAGGRRRWQQVVQQMFAIGVSALPMVGMM